MSLGTITFIGQRLLAATAPIPTEVFLSNRGSEPISLEGLEINGQEVLPKGWAANGAGTDLSARPSDGFSVSLPVGRPASVKAKFSRPPAAAPVCELEPRPYGKCSIEIAMANSAMTCEYRCKVAEASN